MSAKLLLRILVAACVLLVVAEFFFDKQGHFGFEEWAGFHAIFGFATFFGAVLAGKHLRRLLMRKEDYYDE